MLHLRQELVEEGSVGFVNEMYKECGQPENEQLPTLSFATSSPEETKKQASHSWLSKRTGTLE